MNTTLILLLLLSCNRTPSPAPQAPLSVGVEVTNGRFTPEGIIDGYPSMSLTVAATSDDFDTSPLSVDYTIDGHKVTLPPFYLDWESHDATVSLLDDEELLGSIIGSLLDRRLNFTVEGVVSVVHPDSGKPLELPFGGTVWMDTGDELSVRAFIGTPRGRHPLDGDTPLGLMTHETDTVIILYDPADAIFSADISVSYDDGPESDVRCSSMERGGGGLFKVPFHVAKGVSGIEVAVDILNSRTRWTAGRRSPVTPFPNEDFDFKVTPADGACANNPWAVTLSLKKGNTELDYHATLELMIDAEESLPLLSEAPVRFTEGPECRLMVDLPLVPMDDYTLRSTLTYTDGDDSASRTVTQPVYIMWEPVQSINIDETLDGAVLLYPGEYTFSYSVYPENASCKDIYAVSSPEGWVDITTADGKLSITPLKGSDFLQPVQITLWPEDGFGGYSTYLFSVRNASLPPKPAGIQLSPLQQGRR